MGKKHQFKYVLEPAKGPFSATSKGFLHFNLVYRI